MGLVRKPTTRAVAVLVVVALVALHVVLNSSWSDFTEASSLLLVGGGGGDGDSSELTHSHLRHGANDADAQPQRDEQKQPDKDAASANEVKSVDAEGKKQDKAVAVADAQVKSVDTEKVKQDTAANTETEQKDGAGGITVSSTFITYLQTLDTIPRKVHIFFPDKEFANKPDPPSIVQHGILSLLKLNPNWNVTVYDDADIDVVIDNAKDILSKEERDILLGQPDGKGGWKGGAHVVEKTDLARLILIYTQGGLYMDVDRVVNVKLDDLFGSNTRMCLPTVYNANFMQDLMCSSANNSLFLEAIKEQSQKRLTGGKDGGPLERRGGWATTNDLFSMGPPTYNRVVARLVFGKDGQIPGDDLPEARAALEKTNGVIVTKKVEWCDGLLVTPFEGCKRINRDDLYSKYGLKGWNDAVKARWNADTK